MEENCYVPHVCKMWGDWITALWAGELYSTLNKNHEIIMDPTYQESPNNRKDIREYVKLPWVHKFECLSDVKTATSKYDNVIATHHRHCHKRSMYAGSDGNKLRYFDAHGLNYRFIQDQWFPTFHPSDRLLEEYAALKLPDDYAVIHLNDKHPTKELRNKLPFNELITGEPFNLIKDNPHYEYVISTGVHIDNTVNLSNLSGWLKLYIMIKASICWSSHSGFTSIAAVYANDRPNFLVNANIPGCYNMGPPPIAYSNHKITKGSRNYLYEVATSNEKYQGENYRLFCEKEWKNWNSFSTLGIAEFEKTDYEVKSYYKNVDNCLVPLDAKFYNMNDPDKNYDFRENSDMFNISNDVLNPKLFERYWR